MESLPPENSISDPPKFQGWLWRPDSPNAKHHKLSRSPPSPLPTSPASSHPLSTPPSRSTPRVPEHPRSRVNPHISREGFMQPMRVAERTSKPGQGVPCFLQQVQDRTRTSVTRWCFEGGRKLQETEKPGNTFAKPSVIILLS